MSTAITRRSLLGALAATAVNPALAACGASSSVHLDASRTELVVGPGGWCWFQAPRALLDGRGHLWVGSTQGRTGPRPGAVEITRVDLSTASVGARHVLAVDRPDDHTSPAVWLVEGEIQFGWAPHRQVDWIELGRIGGSGHELARVQVPGALDPPARGTAYVAAHHVGGRSWVLSRGPRFSWALLDRTRHGGWRPRGLLIEPRPSGQRPYLLGAADGDRLHLLVSSGNPTEFRGCHVAHGFVDRRLRIYDARGRRVGRVGDAPAAPAQLTRVLRGRAGDDEAHDTDAWFADLRFVDGELTALLVERDPWPAHAPRLGGWRHRYWWARLGTSGCWEVEHLAWAGSELYRRQPDYAGLGALDPLHQGRTVISTNVHPETGTALVSERDGRVHWELFEGRRTGGRWHWTPLTRNSESDQLRPSIVADRHHRAVLWMRGTYRSWMDFDTSIVLRLG